MKAYKCDGCGKYYVNYPKLISLPVRSYGFKDFKGVRSVYNSQMDFCDDCTEKIYYGVANLLMLLNDPE
jgi:hypothetical protein